MSFLGDPDPRVDEAEEALSDFVPCYSDFVTCDECGGEIDLVGSYYEEWFELGIGQRYRCATCATEAAAVPMCICGLSWSERSLCCACGRALCQNCMRCCVTVETGSEPTLVAECPVCAGLRPPAQSASEPHLDDVPF